MENERTPSEQFKQKSALVLGKLAAAEDLMDMIEEKTTRVETGARELLAEVREKQPREKT